MTAFVILLLTAFGFDVQIAQQIHGLTVLYVLLLSSEQQSSRLEADNGWQRLVRAVPHPLRLMLSSHDSYKRPLKSRQGSKLFEATCEHRALCSSLVEAVKAHWQVLQAHSLTIYCLSHHAVHAGRGLKRQSRTGPEMLQTNLKSCIGTQERTVGAASASFSGAAAACFGSLYLSTEAT